MLTSAEKSTEANRLYWETETSVGEIAQRLELSRRALYDALEPIASGARCSFCGGAMVYENRSARSANQPICSACGAQSSPEPEPAAHAEQFVMPAIDERTMRLGGAMVAGAIAGAIVTLIAVRRR